MVLYHSDRKITNTGIFGEIHEIVPVLILFLHYALCSDVITIPEIVLLHREDDRANQIRRRKQSLYDLVTMVSNLSFDVASM